MSGGIRAPTIPGNVKKMIQNIKEITGNHTDEEIHSMLKECSMDPNETAQKLLHQDTFHEVKRRRDRKKENQTNREIADPRWRSGPPGRGGRGGRGNYSSRYPAQDAGGGRNTFPGKENGVNQASDKAGSNSSPASQEAKRIDDRSTVTDMANGPVGVLSGGTKYADTSVVLPGNGTKQTEMSTQPQSRTGGSKRSNLTPGAKTEVRSQATFSGVCSSTSDPVLFPSSDTRGPAVVGAIRREVGSQRSLVEPNSNISTEHKPTTTSEIGKVVQGKMGGKSQGAGKYQAEDFLQPSSLNHGSSSSSRPSSNYGNRSQQSVGSQKVGLNKEWKPKPTNTSSVQGPKTPAISESSIILPETSGHTQPVEKITDSGEATNKVQKELESLHVRDAQHVIIPNHIHVPEAVRTGLSFGSFDAAFVASSKHSTEPENENSKSVPETHHENEVTVEQTISQNTGQPAEEADYVDHSQSPKKESLSCGVVNIPSSSVPDFTESKETANGPQHSGVHTSVGYNLGLVPPMLGNPLGPLEASETQARDVSRVPGFVVQQPVDPSSFYAQFYRSGVDNDGRVSPFPAHGVASKYSGNVAVLSSQSSQSPQEGGNSLVFSAAAQTPLATQAAGVMPSSIAVTQQPMPIFRQPAGVHLPQYPPNYIPYGHYISPFYVPPPAMHQFLGNNAFPQQAQAASVYPAAAAASTAVKFPLSQYKPGSNAGNSMHMGGGGGYGPYGASPGGFNHGPAATAGNATANEDLAASQFKESVYITGQQSEGSTVWFPAPGRDITSLPANAFYNLPPHGQHVTFAPAQVGQGTYGGIYHPAQAVTAATIHPLLQQSQAMPGAVEMVGPTASVYQQPQHAQMNWPSSY